MPFDGLSMAIAWPQAWCKGPGSWYDGLLEAFSVSKGGYYKVGHAAVVLIDRITSNCYYFDFGRYHAPAGYGRVRDMKTDHDLTIKTKAEWDKKGRLINPGEIREELQQNESCHGDGEIHTSFCRIDFAKAYNKAKQMQQNSPIRYGPFLFTGTNCSRFVRSVVLAGQPTLRESWLMQLPFTFSPMPLWNVKMIETDFVIPDPDQSLRVPVLVKTSRQ